MKKGPIITWFVLLLLIGCGLYWMYFTSATGPDAHLTYTPKADTREIVQYSLAADNIEKPSVAADDLPTFTYDISEPKFQNILQGPANRIKNNVEAKITYEGNEKNITSIETTIGVNEEKHQLIVHPDDLPGFQPGKYKLSLKLRTLEGDINIEQDFTWGVIAVNTNKSIYKPGDIAKIGIGVLNNRGETQCMTGLASARVWLKVTEPNGTVKDYSTENGSIKDSGECGPTTVTNEADFVSIYMINGPGLYKMKVTAEVDGEKRTIEDYFKVAEDPAFDIERTSFPTRIYPKATYNVVFTVTPKDDYNGRIEEFMPSDFWTEKISGEGKEEKLGELKKITWDVKLKKGTAQKFTYIIHFPPVSPEFYLLGPIKIGSFKEARQWQIASDALNTTTGVVAYEDNSTQNTWYRTWTGSGYSGEGQMATGASTPTDSRWFREVSNPKTGEKLMAVLDNDATEVVYVYRWTGTAPWIQDLRIVLSDTTGQDSRIIDIAYEELSGDALLVFADKSIGAGGDTRRNQILYRRKPSGGAWSNTATVDTSDLTTGTSTTNKKWIRLKPQLNSDQILMGYVNTGNYVGAQIWDGATNTFGDEIVDNVSGGGTQVATNAQEPMDIVWETQSTKGMIIYGTSGEDVAYREFTGSWGAEQTPAALSGFSNDVAWLVASANQLDSSNEIALGTVELTTQTCRFAIWDGSVWTQGSTVACRANIVQREIGVVWEYNTTQIAANSKAMWAYVTNAAPTQLSYRTWQNGVFSSDSAITGSPNGANNLLAVQLYSDSLSLGIVVLTSVVNGANAFLYSREWDGSVWGSFSRVDTHANGIQGNTESAEAYGFGFDRNLETLVSYWWYENNPTGLGALSGASELTELTGGQDTPTTLTSGGQQFRLRLLLYYPDSLLTSAGRQYKLQYVDKGTGTCENPSGGTPSTYIDVPDSGGTGISFYNNASLNDGDNIATNSAEPAYSGLTRQYQDYEESNNFTNSRTNILGDQVSIWDFALVDNSTYDRIGQTFCFRVARSSDLLLRANLYPEISTASLSDVLIQGGTTIQGGTLLQ